ncbi:MAG: S-methyl-5-thioribose-1-phosphate isomerase [Spirochaetota bacterium]|nr:S-methyl-5-thioribose-1-phosphate isomerase [Spirochaetota bacterium]
MPRIETISFNPDYVSIIDQTMLPLEKKIIRITNHLEMGDAIKRLAIRGAPAIGIAAAFGVYLGIKDSTQINNDSFIKEVNNVINYLRTTRPTAINLFWALDEVKNLIESQKTSKPEQIKKAIYDKAVEIFEDDIERSKKIGEYGEALFNDGDNIITHCNAGGLATSGYGTALAPIFIAKSKGKNIHVYADETRPLLQGARLTTWELIEQNIDVTLISDNMAAHVMKVKKIDGIIVGADRITLNGDVANKIGTYSLAINAKEHNIPFYVAAPLSTFDPNLENGEDIPIEERDPLEITEGFGKRTAPEGVKVYSPAFDVTPNRFIKAIITEKGIIYQPFRANIEKFLKI